MQQKKKRLYLFIDTNLAKARDMTYISPEAWRKYLLSGRKNVMFKKTSMEW
jgi:hypothetical protein